MPLCCSRPFAGSAAAAAALKYNHQNYPSRKLLGVLFCSVLSTGHGPPLPWSPTQCGPGFKAYIGDTQGLYEDNAKENGNCYDIVNIGVIMSIYVYIGDTLGLLLLLLLLSTGILQNEMEPPILHRDL